MLSSLAASLGAVAAGASQLGGAGTATAADEMPGMDHDASAAGAAHSGHAGFARGGVVDSAANGFDPSLIVRDFDWGRTSQLPDGRTLREWDLVAGDKEIEIAPGVKYAAWTFNGRVPGPTLRCVDGDRLRIRFSNGSAHPHTVHFHGIHPSQMDGVPGLGEDIGGGLIQPGQSFTYEFDAGPFGLHLYHCHASPLAAHIAKGLYGMFIVDPKEPRAQADELVMVMNAFDTNFDFGNEIYAVNTVGFHYLNNPIKVKRDAARPHLPRQRPRVRPDQLLPPARQLLPLLPDGDVARARGVHGHDQPGAGTARDPRAASSRTRASTCSTPTRRNSPSWAGWASSRSRTDERRGGSAGDERRAAVAARARSRSR